MRKRPSEAAAAAAGMRKRPSEAAAAAAAAAAEAEAVMSSATAAVHASEPGGVRGHALFFDHLVELIPPRFYLPAADEDRPWYQGLSKTAKAAMKAQSRANRKAARRTRLDPSASHASTLDLLKKSVADQAPNKKSQQGPQESDDGSDDDEEHEDKAKEEETAAAAVSEDRSITYEELQERLQRRIAELRGNRCTRPEFLNKPKKEKGNKTKGKKGKMEDGKKRKRDDGDEEKGKDGKKQRKELEEKVSDIAYGQVWVDPKDARKRKKRKIRNKKKALEQAKRLQDAKQDPDKGNKVSWKTAVSRAAGEKVHDDPKLIKESMKREKKQQQKHAEQWKERRKTVEQKKKEKQRTRTENIRERAHQKKMRKIEKREKKPMRPGFEGRKDGYINE